VLLLLPITAIGVVDYLIIGFFKPIPGLKAVPDRWPEGVERLPVLHGRLTRWLTRLRLAGEVDGTPVWVFGRKGWRLFTVIVVFRFRGGELPAFARSGRIGDVVKLEDFTDMSSLWDYYAEGAGEWIAVEFRSTWSSFKAGLPQMVPAALKLAKALRLHSAQGAS
jgi:hypothetical protein